MTFIIQALITFGLRMAKAFASQMLIEWIVFKALECAAAHTETKVDDEAVQKLKEAFKQANS
ncbi:MULTISPECIES: hypothetical protein [Gammaproteobacteria]|uniref:hypothetical protein n=1 Tax=Gammaproteobacteria TaxID=1236 RepID=UPI00225318A0|nr:hypothetical protein [Aeromonas caviae]MCX4071950.1 hypothetical protein [Aeromonas caviae]